MSKSKLIKKADNQIYFTVFVCVLWSRSILMEYLKGLLLKLPIVSAVANIITPLIMIVFFLLATDSMFERLKGVDFVFVLVCLTVFGLEYVLFPSNAPYYDQYAGRFIIAALPFYFVGVALRSGREKELLELLYKISFATIIAFAVYYLLIRELSEEVLRDGDMDAAYNLLPHVCLVFDRCLKKPNAWNISVFSCGSLLLVLMGSRGPVLCLAVFVVVLLLISKRMKHPIFLLVIAAAVVLFVVFGGLLDTLLQWGYYVADELGLSTRVFDKYLAGNLTVSSARTDIRLDILEELRYSPILGLGIYGDCLASGGYYAHNLFVEILAHYGYLIGTILLISLIVLIVRALRYALKQADESQKLIMLLLLGYNVKLFVSSSYLREAFLFLLIGYSVALIRKKREEDRAKVKKYHKRAL